MAEQYFEGRVIQVMTGKDLGSTPPGEIIAEVLTGEGPKAKRGHFTIPEELSSIESGTEVKIVILTLEQRGSGSPYRVELKQH